MTSLSSFTLSVGLACCVAASGTLASRADAQSRGAPPSGSALYRTYCASCHGVSGRGNGPVSAQLRRPPANLANLAAANKGVFPADRLTQIIDGRYTVRVHGGSDMPVWGDALSKHRTASDEAAVRAKIRALVAYLESIQQRPAE